MTLLRQAGRCAWCGARFEGSTGPGRPRRYCRRSCRQREYEARRRAAELGLGEHELIVTRQELDGLRDRLFLLTCAMEDLAAADAADEGDAVAAVLDAARELAANSSP